MVVQFFTVPTVVGHHDGAGTSLDGRQIWRHVQFPESSLVANDVVVAMNGIHSIDQRNFEARFQRELLVFAHGGQPGLRQVVMIWNCTAAIQFQSDGGWGGIQLVPIRE